MPGPILNQGVGYGLIVGLGLLFAGFMIVITWSLKRYNYEVQTSEMFTTAGNTVKSGLVASSVVSTWTWVATLLQSTGVAYRYGVSGPFWYAAGATIQIVLFATLAIELKRRAPNAHTFLEVIRARYGPVTHGVFIVFCLFTNILVTAMLLTGGAAVIDFLTGAPAEATVFIFPIGIVAYTLFGGIKATFITDYINVLAILVIIFTFAFEIYANNSLLGSPGKMWDLLTELAKERPLEGNAEGSYLTMFSRGGGEFFVINIIGNCGTVFLDNSYYNKAIASSPVHALPGYIMGGLAWFAVPWLCATTMGLAALALEQYDVWPTFPERMSDADVTAGLVLPNTAVAILGKGGAVATLFLAFMAIMSTYSSELISVSSITTYDIYKTYFKPDATGKQLMRVNYVGMTAFAVLMGAFATLLFRVGVSMGYLYLLMGCCIGSGVLPGALTLLWADQSWAAATFSPPLGFACSMTAWLVTTRVTSGEITVETSGANTPMLVGNVVALLSPLLFIPILTYLPPFKPQRYDWQSMLDIRKADDSQIADEADVDIEQVPGQVQVQGQVAGASAECAAAQDAEYVAMAKSVKVARWLTVGLSLCFLVLWPFPLFGTRYIFSREFFTGWVVVGIIWLFATSGVVVFLPLWESRATIRRTSRAMFGDLMGLTGRRIKAPRPEVVQAQPGSGSGSTSGSMTSPTDGEVSEKPDKQ